MIKLFSKLFDSNQKIIDSYQKIVDQINALETDTENLKDSEIAAKTEALKKRVSEGETLDAILPEAFALVREASKRTLKLRHFDVQLMAGIAFHQGKVAEQKTGEGKTLSATLALYLNSLAGKGAHLVTVNDYLAQRDAGWMGPLFHLLGVSVGVIYSGQGDLPASIYDPEYIGKERGDSRLEHLRPVERRLAYGADITYGTNNEFGFDYLRDNMIQSLKEEVQRGHFYAIVDEVDSILIDEARTPLIISAPDTEANQKYYEFAKLITTLSKDIDYTIDEKARTVNLTDYGLKRLEKRLGIDNLYEKDYDTIHHVEQALKAKSLFIRDKDYVVKEGQVIIVDEHTGRLMYGRRYSEGLHQAIEAKENVVIQKESRTLATISLQNYFRMYQKLAGMTGTAVTEAEEFNTIYHMDVVAIPTNNPVQRLDYPDSVYKTNRAKMGAIVKEVREKFDAGQPVLLGTKSIEQNEIMSRYLKHMKIPHQLLNAKNHEKEALILADAGKPKAVTVATNIAGRGVDIVLGGAPPEKADKKTLAEWQKNHELVKTAGGLHVIGTDRHDSRRIDNQLRGRSGRQGDPGSSRFYVSLEDDLMRIFGGEQVSKLMDLLKIPEDQPIESGVVSKSIQQAQAKVEGFYLDQRKRVVEYDDVMNKQREIIYKRRRAVLEEADAHEDDSAKSELKTKILSVLDKEIENIVQDRYLQNEAEPDYQGMILDFLSIIPFDKASQEKILHKISKLPSAESIVDELQHITHQTYQDREKQLGLSNMRSLERFVMLSAIDRLWMDHLEAIDDLREGIWLRGGKDTVVSEYKREAFDLFAGLLDSINLEVAHQLFRIQIQNMSQPTIPEGYAEHQDIGKLTPVSTPASTAGPAKATKKGDLSALAAALSKTKNLQGSSDGRNPMMVEVKSHQPKIGRNDPCPCGSGKKWKKCGMINAPEHQG